MKIRYTYIIVGALVVVSIVLAYDALTSYISPYLSVSDVAEYDAAYINKDVQVLGVVVNGSSDWAEDGSFLFNITDGQYGIKVTYIGTSPQNFKEGQQVVVIGQLISPNHLIASEMLVKCPSKYEGEEQSLLGNPVFFVAMLIGSAALVYYIGSIVLKKASAT